MEMTMGSTANVDLHAEVPITDLKLPPEKLTPEYRAMAEKFYTTPLTPKQEEIIRTQGPVLRSGTPITDAFREWQKNATPQQLQEFADAGNAIAGALRAASPPGAGDQGPENGPMQITYDQFRAIDVRVGEVKSVEPVPKADKLLKLIVDFGELGAKVVVAGIAKSLVDAPMENGGGIQKIVGKRYAFVVNLEPRKLKGIESQAMILAVPDALDPEKVVLTECPGGKVGARLA
jgi:methionine--tRNA ligase beta chain